jgi:hypothetical protein
MGAGLTLTEQQVVNIIITNLDDELQTKINEVKNSNLNEKYKQYAIYLLESNFTNKKKDISYFKNGLNPDKTPINK